MSDLMMNTQTYATTTYPMMCVRSVCHISYLEMKLLTPWCISDHYVWINDECTHMCGWWHYIHHVVCQTTLSDLAMNAHTYVTDDTTYTMVYIRTLCQIQCWMYTYVQLITLFTPCCVSDHYVWFNDKCTHMC